MDISPSETPSRTTLWRQKKAAEQAQKQSAKEVKHKVAKSVRNAKHRHKKYGLTSPQALAGLPPRSPFSTHTPAVPYPASPFSTQSRAAPSPGLPPRPPLAPFGQALLPSHPTAAASPPPPSSSPTIFTTPMRHAGGGNYQAAAMAASSPNASVASSMSGDQEFIALSAGRSTSFKKDLAREAFQAIDNGFKAIERMAKQLSDDHDKREDGILQRGIPSTASSGPPSTIQVPVSASPQPHNTAGGNTALSATPNQSYGSAASSHAAPPPSFFEDPDPDL